MRPVGARARLHRLVPVGRDEIAAVSRRSQQVLLLDGVTGVATGLVVAGFEELTHAVLEAMRDLPQWAQAVAPLLGLVIAALSLRFLGNGTGTDRKSTRLNFRH